jgi:ketosteroid isomerase-like protein
MMDARDGPLASRSSVGTDRHRRHVIGGAHGHEDARAAGETTVNAYDQANIAQEAPSLAALYAEEVIFISPFRSVSGWAAIQASFADDFKRDDYTPEPSKPSDAKALSNDVLVRMGTWSGTYQGKDRPVHLQGDSTTTAKREGGVWKIRMETWGITRTS